jgi:LuxR family maltose regulon positive regulatory protein
MDVSDDILTTKISVPPTAAGMVPRQRLVPTGPFPRLTLIVSPAGFGKSTCAVALSEAFSGSVGWLSLDEDDGAPRRFLVYLVASLRRTLPSLSDAPIRALSTGSRPEFRSIIVGLINEIAAEGAPVCQVIDDLHLAASPVIERELAFLVSHSPVNLHWIMTSREDPGLPLPRLRARGEVREIRPEDLRFTGAETDLFFRTRGRLVLSSHDREVVHRKTEGWAAGLQMALLSMAHAENHTEFVGRFDGTHRHIADYLTTEVLASQPDSVQRFLIRCSILGRLTGGLCDALGNDSELPGADTLEYLERANIFVTPLDEHREWFRMHPLFAELLRARIEGDRAELHRRAAEWLISHGFFAESFTHAAQSGHPTLIRRSVDASGTPLYARRTGDSVLDVLESLPPELRDSDPMLWIHQAWATWGAYRSDDVPPLLERAGACSLGDVRVGAHIHALKANLAANRYDVEGMRRNADAALNLVDDGEPYVRASIIRIQAAAHHFSGEFLDASVTYRGALSICDRTGDVLTAILAETGLGMVLEEMGQTEEAQIRFESVIERAGDPNQPITCEAHAGIGRLAGERGDVAAAVDQLRHARELARRIQGIDSHITAGLALCRVHIAAGDAERARHELARTAREIDSGAYEHYRDTVEQLESTISRLRSFPEQSEPGTRNHPAGGAGGSSPDALTRREREILGLIADGLSNDEIATRLFLSLSTVKGHNTRIFEKLRVHRRTEAVAEARRQGVL